MSGLAGVEIKPGISNMGARWDLRLGFELDDRKLHAPEPIRARG
jgi:hypothetical protein